MNKRKQFCKKHRILNNKYLHERIKGSGKKENEYKKMHD